MIAHINEKQEEQSLQEHCQRVAFYTAAALQSVRLSKLGYLIGLLHDWGKQHNGLILIFVNLMQAKAYVEEV